MKQLERLRSIQRNLEQRDDALALIALGSVGIEQGRLDRYSDIGFLVIVQDGALGRFVQDTAWLHAPDMPLDYLYQHTANSFRLMYADGLYGELALYEAHQVPDIVARNGLLLWARAGYTINPAFHDLRPPRGDEPAREMESLMDEALSNLYVGLTRYLRGERLAGYELVMHKALHNLLSTLPHMTWASGPYTDPYDPFRRAEENYPSMSRELSAALGGIEAVPQAAGMLLDFILDHWTPNPTMVREIRRFLQEAGG